MGSFCKSSCTLVFHVAFALICLLGFAGVVVISGMWLGGKSLGTFIETDGVGVDELKNFCANDTLIGYATADNIEDLINN